MARNGSGAMSIDNADFQSGANIVANELDANFTTIVAELTNSVAVDGQSTMSGDLAMGTNKITGSRRSYSGPRCGYKSIPVGRILFSSYD